MASRGRCLVEMCQKSTGDETNENNNNIIQVEESQNCKTNDNNFIENNERIFKETEQEEYNLLTCESAPASVLPKSFTNTINPPLSAPMPLNHDSSPMSISEINIDVNNEMLHRTVENSSPINSSPIRPLSDVSGIDILPLTDEEPFADSGSSWIPDSEEDCARLRKRKVSSDSTINSKENLISIQTNQEKKKIRKKRLKKSRNVSHVSDKDTSHESVSIINNENIPLIANDVQNYTVPNMSNSPTEEITVGAYDNNYLVVAQDNAQEKRRWKKGDPKNWTRSKEIKKKREGLPYKDRKGKVHRAKVLKDTKCSSTCRYQCDGNFSEEERQVICNEYWKITDFKLQKEFLLKRIKLKAVKRTLKNLPPEKQRTSSREYGFFKEQTQFVRVCKNFFMSTICISTGPIETAVKNINNFGTFDSYDGRGKHRPSNKTTDENVDEVKKHIESFAVVESHYCRKKSSKKYLDPNLSIAKMYNLYKIKMTEINKVPVKLNVYKKIFGTQYNLSFFHPKKDQCCLCNKYNRAKDRDVALENEYKEHILRKDASYKSKAIDKKRSEEDASYLCITMDLQSLLQIPSTSDSLLYYCRKLNLYNLSIYEFKPPENQAHCLIWTEINGKRGSIEIASALNKWIKDVPVEVTHITIYSDTCSGQNRNQYMAAFLLHLIQSHPHLTTIEQKYLESGHTFMEVDSMHSAIEKEKRHTEVYSVIDWKAIMHRARSKRYNSNRNPYIVKELTYNDMIDVKELASQIIKNRTITDDGKEKVNWLKIKCLRFEKQFPGIIKFRYDYDGPYLSIDTLSKPSRQTRSTPAATIAECNLQSAYTRTLPITMAKKKDLLMLCQKNIIPLELHAWYKSLPASSAQPDVNKSDVESE